MQVLDFGQVKARRPLASLFASLLGLRPDATPDERSRAVQQAIAGRTDLFSGVTGILTLRGTVNVQSQAKTLTILGVMANYGEVRKNIVITRQNLPDLVEQDDAAQPDGASG